MTINKTKVCHLTSVHPPFDIRIFYKECVSLANNGFDVALIAPIDKAISKNGVNIIPIHLPQNRFKRMLLVSFRMFSLALKQKASIYHFHDPELMLCGVLLRLFGKKVIYDIHENVRLTILDKPYLSKLSRFLMYYLYIAFEKVCNLFYHKLVLALSEETFEQYYPAKKSLPIINFPLKVDAVNKTKPSGDVLRLIYVGVVHEYRGAFEMLELAKLLLNKGINFSFDIVGIIRPESLEQDLYRIIIEEKLEDKINFHGFVDATKIASFLEKADIGISLLRPYKRYQEALPTKIFEYMQQGLPVITNNFELLKAYVEKKSTGICIDYNNMEKGVSEIIELIKDKPRMKEMSENGIKLTQEKWNWESQEKKLIALYNQILKH